MNTNIKIAATFPSVQVCSQELCEMKSQERALCTLERQKMRSELHCVSGITLSTYPKIYTFPLWDRIFIIFHANTMTEEG